MQKYAIFLYCDIKCSKFTFILSCTWKILNLLKMLYTEKYDCSITFLLILRYIIPLCKTKHIVSYIRTYRLCDLFILSYTGKWMFCKKLHNGQKHSIQYLQCFILIFASLCKICCYKSLCLCWYNEPLYFLQWLIFFNKFALYILYI